MVYPRGPFLLTLCFLLGCSLSIAGSAHANPGGLLCNLELLDTGPHAASRELDELLEHARTSITHEDAEFRKQISKKLLARAIQTLSSAGVSVFVDPEGRWIDILPQGSDWRSRFSASLQADGRAPRILRYEPLTLLTDAYQGHSPYPNSDVSAIYISHGDLFGFGFPSHLLKAQVEFADLMSASIQKMRRDPELPSFLSQTAPVTEADHAQDWLFDPKRLRGQHPISEELQLVYRYLDRSPMLIHVSDPRDPYAVRFSEETFTFRQGMDDFNIWKMSTSVKDGIVEITIPGSLLSGAAEKLAFDMFLGWTALHRNWQGGELKRAVHISATKSLIQINGAWSESEKYFRSYLKFLEGIYTSASGLSVSPAVFAALREATLSMRTRSQLVSWANGKRWIRDPSQGEVMGGLVLVKSGNDQEPLPIELANPGFKIERRDGEILVEMGRLGALTPHATLEFLKIAGVDLVMEGKGKKVRVICEADRTRAAYFRRFGFKPSELKLDAQGYYASGTEQVLEANLEDFLRAVLK